MKIKFEELAQSFQDFLVEQYEENEVNPIRFIAVALTKDIDITKENEDLQDFVDNAYLEAYSTSLINLSNDDSRIYHAFIENEAYCAVRDAREELEEQLIYEAPIIYREYIDFKLMAEDQIADLYDVYPQGDVYNYVISLECENDVFKDIDITNVEACVVDEEY